MIGSVTDAIGGAGGGGALSGAVDGAGDTLYGAGESAERFIATGKSRTVYDFLADYDEEWHGSNDTQDLIGPSLSLSGLSTDSEHGVIDYRSEQSQQNDPTNPDNWGTTMKATLAIVVVTLIATLLGQLFDIQLGE